MPNLFRIQTDRVTLTWRTRGSSEPTPLGGIAPPPGLLAITPRRRAITFQQIERAAVSSAMTADWSASSGPRLFEQRDYHVLIESKIDEPASLRHRDPNITRDVTPGANASGIVNFGSSIGRSRFSVFLGDTPELDFEVEVFPTKLDYATDYHEILADVRELLTTLALEYLQTTERAGGLRHTARTTRLDWLTILRHVVGDLEKALYQVARQPHRAIVREPASIPAHRLKKVDSGVRRTLSRPPGPKHSRLSNGLYVPPRLPEREAKVSLDTPEHRWLAAQLEGIRRQLARIRSSEEQRETTPRTQQVLCELRAMEERVSALERLEPIRSANRHHTPGYASLALLKAHGYREAYLTCLMLSLALHLDGEVLRLPVKDLSLLYEYWCFLKVAVGLSRATRQPIDPRSLLKIRTSGLSVTLAKGRPQTLAFDAGSGRKVSVTYNRAFPGVLLTQQPDFVVSLEEGQWPRVELVLDAKYRIDASERYVKHYRSAGPPEDSLNLLHRYRDAILVDTSSAGQGPWVRTVVQAAALFPFRELSDGQFETSRIWESLTKIGIGAIPLLPQGEIYLQRWLEGVLRQGGWSIAERAIAHRSQAQLWDWRRAASEPVLIGVLRSGAERDHLDWIREQRMYYTPLTRQRRLPAAREIAIYVPAIIQSPGAVRLHAEVVGFEIVPRKEIRTPWEGRRGGDEPQIIFRLADIREDLAVRNIRGERVSDNRWTSRLGLMRAGSLVELLLETEPDWRLYEALTANRVPFSIEPGSPLLHDPDTVRGRAWFVTSHCRIQYRGASGYFAKSSDDRETYLTAASEIVALCRTRGAGSGTS